MRLIALTLFGLVLVSCQNKDATPEFQAELFTYIKEKSNPTAPKCDPSFSTLRNEELTVFCLPPAETGEMREWIKHETTSLIIRWSEEKKLNPKSIQTRFTDEIAANATK